MTINHDDNATAWRDLADALTPVQIAHLEDREARPAPDGALHEAGLLFTAREYVQQNAAGVFYADVAPPNTVSMSHGRATATARGPGASSGRSAPWVMLR